MSGPKCLQVVQTTLFDARRGNRAECDRAAAYFGRVFERLQEVNSRLRSVGSGEVTPKEQPQSLARRATTAFSNPNNDGLEAVRFLYNQKATLESQVQEAENRLKERFVELQQRIRQLNQKVAMINGRVHELKEVVDRFVPADWPAQDRDRLTRQAGQILNSISPVPLIEVVTDSDQFHALIEAETKAEEALQKLDQGWREMENEINQTHSRLVGSQFARKNQPVILLRDVLQKDAVKSKASDGIAAEKLDQLLGKLSVLQNHAAWVSIVAKVAAIAKDADENRRKLHYESLLLECGDLLNHLRTAADWQKKVDELIASAAHVKSTAVDEIVRELDDLRRAATPVDLEPIQQRLHAAVKSEEERQLREEKRRAVIGSLSAIGYDVIEGTMETAMVQGGKILLHKPGESEYAVEVAVDRDLSLVQTALVRFAASNEASAQQKLRDEEREVSWCGDHARLREELKQRGLASNFKLRIPAGQEPVRVIIAPTLREQRDQAVSKGRSQQANSQTT
jgi:predicted MPP superfamily phosphohydrolase